MLGERLNAQPGDPKRIAWEGWPALVGGVECAREHFQHAVALSGGHSVFGDLTLHRASGFRQGPRRIEPGLEQVLAKDDEEAELRLANLVAQKRASVLPAAADRMLK